ncbi:MAG: ABC transporter substrate-binding protein [Caldilineaceae bacterium]|nr:ABC transporter substrate-binding protein [Caldilineaceae bacterium]MDE0336661.1 ABC transporter substrate-binding protein [Caldilineaceae bacterium]
MLRRRIRTISILAVLLALFVMTACVAAAPAADSGDMAADDMGEMADEGYPEEMIIGMGALPVTLVGNTVPSLQSRIFSKLLYDTLAVLNEETGAIDPVLLESMELVDDLTVRIVIKEGIEFHNGEVLTAPGLAKSFELLRDADPQKFTWSFRQLNDYESYEVIDDYTMEFTLLEPIDRWANLFANHMPLAPDHLEAVGLDGYIEEPVGTGPYKFSSWQRDSYITLERWEDYPGGVPVIEKVTFRHMPEAAVRVAALKSGEIHIAAHVPPDQIESLTADGFELYAGDSMQSMYVGINIYGRNEILNDVRVRQAMLYSVDLDGMWNTIAGGFGTKLDCQIVAPGGFGYNENVQTYPYDPEKAKALLTEAGYPDGFTITGSATTGRYFRDRTFMDALAAQWAQVGITVEMEYPESSVWLQELIDQTLPPIMNIGLNWYLSDNTTSMWGPVGDSSPDPAFLDMRAAKSVIVDPVEREAVVKDIAEYICDNAQALHAYTIPALYALSPGLPELTFSKSFEIFIPTE